MPGVPSPPRRPRPPGGSPPCPTSRARSRRCPRSEEAGAAAAYYMPGAIDGSRSGTYFLNTSKPEERHRYAAEDIAFHEAVPGHHFQLTIAMESTDLPAARRVLHDTACAEGWGLYSERLADEMGLYSDDLARMGLFAADSWRAGRLVVDTGLHAMGWSRQQAVDWLAEHTPMPRIEVESEVDRYISYPGQALAYMVGRREIVRLRSWAAEALGARFDLREFHDLVLRAGILPAARAGTDGGALGGSHGATERSARLREPATCAATAPEWNARCASPGPRSPPTVTASCGPPRDGSPSRARAGSARSTAGRTVCSGRRRARASDGPGRTGRSANCGAVRRGRAGPATLSPISSSLPCDSRFIQAQIGTGTPRSSQYSARVPSRNAPHSAARMLCPTAAPACASTSPHTAPVSFVGTQVTRVSIVQGRSGGQ